MRKDARPGRLRGPSDDNCNGANVRYSYKTAFLLIALVLLLPAPGLSTDTETVKVLVLDKSLPGVPGRDEELRKVDVLNGRLVLGFSIYRGKLAIYRSDRSLYVVNELPLETYVAGVVKAEVGSDWAEEALKAQAVIVRTYVLKQMGWARRSEYHVTSSVLHQVYKGRNVDSSIAQAVQDTEGEVLTYDGEPIISYYHSTTDGMTEVPEEVFGRGFPYLLSVPASGKLSPMALWTRSVPLREVALALGVQEVSALTPVSFTSTGRVDFLSYVSGKGAGFVRAKDLRKSMGWKRLPSTDFAVEISGENAVLRGSGFGHGVGLSQWSALEMAIGGKSYTEILSHFYPGTELTRHEGI